MMTFRRILVAGLFLILSSSIPTIAQEEAKKDAAEEFFKFDNKPALNGTSADPITLRYRLKAEQVVKCHMQTDTDIAISQGGIKLNIKQSMQFDAKMAVTDVDGEGNISSVVKITRFQMAMSGMNDMEFDSDKPDEMDENFKPLMAMINVGIPCKMSPIGKMLETDLEPMRLAMRRAGDAAMEKVIEESAAQMFDGTFVELSEQPIKAGETYKAGTIVQDKTKIHVAYKIGAVAGDKKTTILEPEGKMEFAADAFPGIEMKIKKERVGGWIHFDLEQGFARSAEVRAYILMDITADGESGTAEIKARSTATMTVE